MFCGLIIKSDTFGMTLLPKIAIFLCLLISQCLREIEGYPAVNGSNQKEEGTGNLRIVGGKETIPHCMPYQVGLIIDARQFCGGALISTYHVLTAAHCVKNASSIEVLLGFHDLKITEDSQKIIYNPRVIIHEDYDDKLRHNDIAILKLPRSLKFTLEISPITRLADNDSGLFIGNSAVLAGWGKSSHTSTELEYKLKEVHLDIISNRYCAARWTFFLRSVIIADTQICTSGSDSIAGKIGACFGDSGGPLVVNDVLVGLVSFGNKNCEIGFPTVYTRISKYRHWISKYTGV